VDGIWFDSWNNPTWYPADQYPWAQGEKPVFGDTAGTKFDAATFKSQYFYKRDIVKAVHDLNLNVVTFVNDFPPIIPADVVSGEIWTKEDNFKLCETSGVTRRQEILLIPAGYWWYNGTCDPANKPAQLRKFVHCVGSGVNAALSEGPYVNGDFPPPLVEFNNFLHDFLDWAGESLLAPVVPGGHGKGGFPAGAWDNGAYGVTTMLPDARTHYLHVLAPPSGGALSLPDGGYSVSGVSDLRSGGGVGFFTGVRQVDRQGAELGCEPDHRRSNFEGGGEAQVTALVGLEGAAIGLIMLVGGEGLEPPTSCL
jgi:hypothetical protein